MSKEPNPHRRVLAIAADIQAWGLRRSHNPAEPPLGYEPIPELARLRAACLHAPLPPGVSLFEREGILDRVENAAIALFSVADCGTAEMRAGIMDLAMELGKAMVPLGKLLEVIETPRPADWSEPYSIGELSKKFKVHRNTMRTWLKEGRIKSEKAGSKYKIPLTDIPARESPRRP
jgi:excisionase family DNA binding protein